MNETARLHGARVPLPPDGDEFNRWIAMEDAASFLRADLRLSDFVLYSSVADVFMHAVLVPNDKLEPPDYKDLMGWNFNPYHSGWGLVHGFHPPEVTIEPPLRGCGSNSMAAGEQLLFMRSFDGYPQKGTYVDILQKLLHVFSLHFIDERNAYCRLDKRGDLEDVIAINEIDDPAGLHRGGIVVTIKRELLDEFAVVTDTSVVRMFDLTRVRPNTFAGWSNLDDQREQLDGALFYRQHIEPGRASFMRGVQIVRSRMSRDQAPVTPDRESPRTGSTNRSLLSIEKTEVSFARSRPNRVRQRTTSSNLTCLGKSAPRSSVLRSSFVTKRTPTNTRWSIVPSRAAAHGH
jgi:hypothetical protein